MSGRPCVVSRPPKVTLSRAERRTRLVVGLTVVMMVAELVVGTFTRSLSLVADGWHMATHAGALGLSAIAYWYARTRAGEATFAFGTGKVHALSAFTNALLLLLVALAMAGEGVARLLHPEPIRFAEALPVAVLGLGLNLVSFFALHPGDHDHAHHDHNLRAAWMHVAADALTSVTAILALLGGRVFGWTFLDPLMALLGSAVILHWGFGLIRTSARQLLDVAPAPELELTLRERLESFGAVRDLHVWEIEPGRRSLVVSLVTTEVHPLDRIRDAILEVAPMHHLTIELEHAPESIAAF